MVTALLAQSRTITAFAFFGLFAWVFGIDPPVWQRLLIVVLATGGIAAGAFLDENKIRRIVHRHYGTAA